MFICRKLRYETDLAQNKSWKLRYEDLHIEERGSDEIQTKGMTTFKREKTMVRHLYSVLITNTLGTRGFPRVRREFSVSAEGRHSFGHRPKPRAVKSREKLFAQVTIKT